jgi:hypothetical protein
VASVKRPADALVEAGYLLPEGAARFAGEAEAGDVLR